MKKKMLLEKLKGKKEIRVMELSRKKEWIEEKKKRWREYREKVEIDDDESEKILNILMEKIPERKIKVNLSEPKLISHEVSEVKVNDDTVRKIVKLKTIHEAVMETSVETDSVTIDAVGSDTATELNDQNIHSAALASNSLHSESVSYTHLTLPTNREV